MSAIHGQRFSRLPHAVFNNTIKITRDEDLEPLCHLLPCFSQTKFLHGRAGPVARKRNGRQQLVALSFATSLPFSGLTLAPWRLSPGCRAVVGSISLAPLSMSLKLFASDGWTKPRCAGL